MIYELVMLWDVAYIFYFSAGKHKTLRRFVLPLFVPSLSYVFSLRLTRIQRESQIFFEFRMLHTTHITAVANRTYVWVTIDGVWNSDSFVDAYRS
jgi:hypothetical protein